MRVLSFSTKFPSYHPKKGEPTYFVEKILHALRCSAPDNYYQIMKRLGYNYFEEFAEKIPQVIPKYTTIRKGHRWKAGDWFQPVIWGDDINPKSGRSGPYHSKQIKFAPPIEVKKVWDFDMDKEGCISIDNKLYTYLQIGHVLYDSYFEKLKKLSINDGLSQNDFLYWFQYPKPFDGQIICWNDKIEY